MAISRDRVRDMYQSGAKQYDFVTFLFRLIGLRMKAYRQAAVDKLALNYGDVVVELGCGTGLNFPLILEQIGPEGRLTGVDLTTGMLEVARARIERFGWKNAELVQSDVASYHLPERLNGVLATGLFGYIPEYDEVIQGVSKALSRGGHISILDGKRPVNLPSWVFRIVLKLGAQFGYTPEYFQVRPWESVQCYFENVSFETRYGGMIYLLSGTAR